MPGIDRSHRARTANNRGEASLPSSEPSRKPRPHCLPERARKERPVGERFKPGRLALRVEAVTRRRRQAFGPRLHEPGSLGRKKAIVLRLADPITLVAKAMAVAGAGENAQTGARRRLPDAEAPRVEGPGILRVAACLFPGPQREQVVATGARHRVAVEVIGETVGPILVGPAVGHLGRRLPEITHLLERRHIPSPLKEEGLERADAARF